MNENKSTGQRLTELRNSNAPGVMEDRRTKRKRSRAAKKSNAIKDSRDN